MKFQFTLLFAFLSFHALSQKDTGTVHIPVYTRRSISATLSLGIYDMYRHNYSVPAGFTKGNTSGFAPIYARVEYGLTSHISIAANMSYDAFVYNFKQNYTGNNGPFIRYHANNTRIFSGGAAGFYHLNHVIHAKNIDPFVGVGISINNIRYGAYPQGDSTLIRLEHTISPCLKAGARFYLTHIFSLYADAGYDQQSIATVGASCRFVSRKTGK